MQGSLRFSLGYGNSDADIDRLLEVLPEAVGRVREMAPPPQINENMRKPHGPERRLPL